MLSESDKDHLAQVVDAEGFDYAFREYSHFAEIKDAEFHRLRKVYLDAARELESYIEIAD